MQKPVVFSVGLAACLSAGVLAQPKPDPLRLQGIDTKLAVVHAARLQEAIAAVNAGGKDAYLSKVSAQHTFSQLGAPEQMATGVWSWPAVTSLRSRVANFSFTTRYVIAGRRFAVAVGAVTGRRNNRDVGAHALYVAFMRDGAIRHSVVYLGTDELLRQATATHVPTPFRPPTAPAEVVTTYARLDAATLGRVQKVSMLALRGWLAASSGQAEARTIVMKAFAPGDLEGGASNALRTRLTQVSDAVPDLAARLDDLFVAGDYAIALTTFRGTVQTRVAELDPVRPGLRIMARAAVVVKLTSSLQPESVELFLDDRPVRAQLGR